MISAQALQKTVDGFYGITNIDVAVYDNSGQLLASTPSARRLFDSGIKDFISSSLTEMSTAEALFAKISSSQGTEMAVCVRSGDEFSRKAQRLLLLQLETQLDSSRDSSERDNFIKNLLLDNLLLIDIYSRAKKLRIEQKVQRVVMLAENNGNGDTEQEIISQLLADRENDYITSVDEKNVVIIHRLLKNDTEKEMSELASLIVRTLENAGITARVAYGAVADEIKEISRSYKEARLAMDVARVFYENKNVAAYNSLGIGRLIYQLPISFCRMFIEEIFKGRSPDEFDTETLMTINRFFENNLNVSETSRQLFIHRNTLVYRLDKLQKNTGLDLRVFDDAITFKIALMVVRYMDYLETIDY